MTDAGRERWPEYYEATSGRPPWPLFVDAVERFESPGLAVDLGCGAGVETLDLLRRGWRVVAIDAQPAAIDYVRNRVPAELLPRLETDVASFTDVRLPDADFVWSGLSLSFCPRVAFGDLWRKVVECLRPGGRIACDIFGDRHVWSTNTELTFLRSPEVHALIEPLDVEYFVEEEEQRPTVFEGLQHWHAFLIIARNPA